MTETALPLSLSYVDAINAVYDGLNSLEKRIADYILENGTRCKHLSARELAQACGCSGATVVRFARKLNYEGFADLKHHIRTPLRRPDNSLNFSTTTLCQSMVLQLLILRIWQLDPVRFGQESARLRSYTKAKLLDSSPETPASSP